MKIIAHVHTDFPTKFGIPRQSMLVNELKGTVCFEPEYRSIDAIKGLEGFSHIWILWKFLGTKRDNWCATVKPPRLGGNVTRGVFATRSPFRPNDIGMSCVTLESIEYTKNKGAILHIAGVDMMDMTPVYDIKPYLPYADCHPNATGGFASEVMDYELEVEFPEELLQILPQDKHEAIIKVLKQDPRPGYHNNPQHRYGIEFAGFDVRFTVQDKKLQVCEVVIDNGIR